MKTIIALLVMVAISAATSYQWWDFDDLSTTLTSLSGYWVQFYTDSVTYVGSVYVYTLSEQALENGHVGISQYWGQYPETVTMTGSPEWVSDLECWRGRFDLDIDTTGYIQGVFHVYCSTPGVGAGTSTRQTQTMEQSHTFNTNGRIDDWEANIIIYDDPVSLERDTWASIKTSF